MGKKHLEANDGSGQMRLFEVQISIPAGSQSDPEAEQRRVEGVLYERHCKSLDGEDEEIINENGGKLLLHHSGECDFESVIGEEGDIYQVENVSGPPDITPRQAGLIGLTPPRPGRGNKSGDSYSDLVFNFKPGELTNEMKADLRKMAQLAKGVLAGK